MKTIIMAAGSATRWGNYMGIPKQLVNIDGVPILYRTIDIAKEYGDVVLTVPELGYFGDSGVKEIVGSNNNELEKFFNGRYEIDGPTVFLWGDAYFTDNAFDIIYNDDSDLMFFGRKDGNGVKDYGEIFAVRGDSNFIESASDLAYLQDGIHRFASWELYRYINGFKLDEHIIGDYFTVIDDETDDFDYPEDYDNWLKKYR